MTTTDPSKSDGFSVEVSHDTQEIRIVLRGELDLAVIDEAQRALCDVEHDGRPVVVGFHELRFIDLSGVRLLLDAHERLGERLTLRGCSPAVHRLLELTGADEQLPLVD